MVIAATIASQAPWFAAAAAVVATVIAVYKARSEVSGQLIQQMKNANDDLRSELDRCKGENEGYRVATEAHTKIERRLREDIAQLQQIVHDLGGESGGPQT